MESAERNVFLSFKAVAYDLVPKYAPPPPKKKKREADHKARVFRVEPYDLPSFFLGGGFVCVCFFFFFFFVGGGCCFWKV